MREAKEKPCPGDSDAATLRCSLNGQEDWTGLRVVALEGEGCAMSQSGNPQAVIADWEDKKHGRELRLAVGQVTTWLKANPRGKRRDRMERMCDLLALGLIKRSCPGSRQM